MGIKKKPVGAKAPASPHRDAGPDSGDRPLAGAPAPVDAFNPWTSSLEEAMAAQDRDGTPAGPEGPIFQWAAAQEIAAAESTAARATGFRILALVASCALHGLVMPDWLARAFLRRYRAVANAQVASWDSPEAFGLPYPKAHVTAIRRRRLNRSLVANAVSEFVQMHPDKPLDAEWERIGSLVHKSDKEAQKLFAEALRNGIAIGPAEVRERMGWPRVPRKSAKPRGTKKGA